MIEKSLVGVNDFVYRQTKINLKTYSKNLSFKEIAQHSELQFKNGFFKNGYRDGVVVVYADQNLNDNFICPFTKINEKTKLKANITKRSKNESFYIFCKILLKLWALLFFCHIFLHQIQLLHQSIIFLLIHLVFSLLFCICHNLHK